MFRVEPGEPVIVRTAHVAVGDEPARLESIRAVLASFEPRVGKALDHAAYERSKQELATALANEGFLDATLAQHRVEVVRSANSADIELVWDPGPRYRLGPVRYPDTQFPDAFLQRYKPWKDGDFYSAEKLLTLQQHLVDADYFASVAVTPDLEHARDGVVPVDVLLIPAKRTVYTASLYVSTPAARPAARPVARRPGGSRSWHR